MRPGPTPKPTALKNLSGNPGKRALNGVEPQFDVPGRMLPAPDYLTEEGKVIWRDLGKMLLNAGLFATVDKYALGMFCASAARWMEAERKLQKEPAVITSPTTGALYQSPWLAIGNRAWDQMRRMFSEFGLTPAERSRLRVATNEDEPSLAEQLFSMVNND